MPSNEYNGIPAVCRLHLIGNDDPIDLLNANGLCIRYPDGWVPKVAQLKGGGVKIESESMDDDWLVAGGYEAVEETFPLKVDPNSLAYRLEGLQRTLWEAEQYWLSGWQRGAAYLAVQLKEDSKLRYARVSRGSYQFDQYAFGQRTGLPDNTLILEREPFWHDNPPGEMTGPFTNWVPNGSFEFWRDEGISHTRPSGWYVTGTEPTGGYISREDAQIAGPSHALKLGFTSWAGGVNPWGLRAQTSWPGSVEPHTLRFWIKITGASANARVRIILFDSTLTAQLVQIYTSDYTGWVYLPVDAPIDTAGFYIVEVDWHFTGAAVATPGEFVIDRMMLTRGTWTAATWPGRFYMGCGTVWGWEDDENYYTPKIAAVENWHFINHLDVDGVPGDVEAVTRMTIDRLGAEYGEDKNWPLLQYRLYQRRIEPVVDKPGDEEHISLNVDPAGYTGGSHIVVGFATASESAIYCPLSGGDDWLRVVAFRTDGIEETKNYVGRYRVPFRVRWEPDEGYESYNVLIRLVYWIGSEVNAVTLDEVTLAPSDYFRLLNLTPRNYVDWLPYHDDPAALCLAIEFKMDHTEGTGTIWIDDLTLGALDAGCLHAEWDEETPWLVGQGLILDGDEQSPMPVAIGAPNVDPWILESDLGRLIGQPWEVADSQTFNGSLYLLALVGANQYLLRYDYRGWASILITNPTATALEVWNGRLVVAGPVGVLTYDGAGTWAWLDVGPPSLYDVHGFGGWLYGASTAGFEQYAAGGHNASFNVGVDESLVCLDTYKRKLYAGSDFGNLWSYDPLNAQVNLGNPGGGGTIFSLKKWRDKLYLVQSVSGVYSYDGNSFTAELAPPPGFNVTRLQVYDDVLYVGFGDNANAIRLYWTEDGVNWDYAEFPVDSYVGAMQPFHGRMYIGMGFPHKFGEATKQSLGIWHTHAQAKLYTANYTGGAFNLRPKAIQRFYQRLEALNVETGNGDAPDSYILRPTAESDERGPQTQFSIAFDSRWRSLRGE